MKKVALLTALCAAANYSVAAGFDGPFVEVSAAYADTKTELAKVASLSESNVVGKLAAGFSKSYGQFNLAGSIFVLIGEQKAGSVSGSAGSVVGTAEMSTKNTVGFSIEPGFNVSEDALAYVKLGYAQTTGKAKVAATVGSTAIDANESSSFSGFMYGAGGKIQIQKNMYATFEVHKMDYKAKNDFKPSTLVTSLGIGFKF